MKYFVGIPAACERSRWERNVDVLDFYYEKVQTFTLQGAVLLLTPSTTEKSESYAFQLSRSKHARRL